MNTNQDLPGDPLQPAAAGESWWVLHTRSRREKQVARICLRSGVRHYLPLRDGRRRVSGRERFRVPLFPGYVFVCLTPEAHHDLLRSGAIVRSIAVRQPLILMGELRGIRAALEAGESLSPVSALGRGRRVRVVEGPLRGVEGIVGDRRVRRGVVHLVLAVSLIGQGAAVTIDAASVEPVGGWEDGARPGEDRRLDGREHRSIGGV